MGESREAFDLFHPACRANLRHRWRWEIRHRPVAFLLLVASDTWHRVCSSATKAELRQALHDARMELGKESTRLLRLLNTAKSERDEARAALAQRTAEVAALRDAIMNTYGLWMKTDWNDLQLDRAIVTLHTLAATAPATD